MEKLFKRFCVFLSGLIIVCTVGMVFTVPSYKRSNKHIDIFSYRQIIDNIENLELNLTSAVYVKDKSGKWQEYQRLHGNENRIWVSIDNVPKQLQDAYVAIEDERFYEHSGVDWKRTLGAVGNLIFKYYSSNQGGSTITQQLIKNVTDDKGENVFRKIREITRALLIEKKLDKKQILEAYLNTISLGNGICGVQVASNYYFNKNPDQLSLVECAAIACITKHPYKYEPINHPEENKARRKIVLDKMLEHEMITQAEYDEAVNADITLDLSQRENYEAEINSYFVDALIDEVIGDLAEKYNCSEEIASTMLYNGGYKIYSTINPNIQADMEKVYSNINTYFKQTDKGVGVQSAMTVMDYQGHIVGIVGGVGEKTVNRGLNRATDSPRQPGSTMKPIGVYALAIENGIANYSTMVPDKPIENYYGSGKSGPKEWYGYYKGNITVQYALEKSANTIPVRLLRDVGLDTSFDFLKNKLGCKSLTDVDKNLASLALGGCEYGITTTESAAAYAIFGNQGKYYKPTTYYKIERANGEVIFEENADTGTQVISPSTATIMNHLLQNVVYGGEGTGKGIASYNSMKVYAKTGTSSESNDLWMVAGTPYYVGSVWYGFDQPAAVKNAGAAAAVWKAVMTDVHKGLSAKQFEDSDDVYTAKYCTSTGKLAGDSCGGTKVGYYKKDSKVEKCSGSHGGGTASAVSSEVTPSTSQATTTSEVQSSSSNTSQSSSSAESSPSSSGSSTSTAPPSSGESSTSTESETTN